MMMTMVGLVMAMRLLVFVLSAGRRDTGGTRQLGRDDHSCSTRRLKRGRAHVMHVAATGGADVRDPETDAHRRHYKSKANTIICGGGMKFRFTKIETIVPTPPPRNDKIMDPPRIYKFWIHHYI